MSLKSRNFASSAIFWAALALSQVQAQEASDTQSVKSVYENISGLGNGIKFVIACVAISVIGCFFRESTFCPNFCVFLAILFPLLVLLIIYILPKDNMAVNTDTAHEVPTDNYFLRTIVFFIIILVLMIVSCIQLCSVKVLKTVQVRRIDSELGNKFTSVPIVASEKKGDDSEGNNIRN